MVVCLEESLFVHNIRDMKVLHTIRDTPPNARGVCDLASADCSHLAYPGSTQVGQLHVFDAANLVRDYRWSRRLCACAYRKPASCAASGDDDPGARLAFGRRALQS